MVRVRPVGSFLFVVQWLGAYRSPTPFPTPLAPYTLFRHPQTGQGAKCGPASPRSLAVEHGRSGDPAFNLLAFETVLHVVGTRLGAHPPFVVFGIPAPILRRFPIRNENGSETCSAFGWETARASGPITGLRSSSITPEELESKPVVNRKHAVQTPEWYGIPETSESLSPKLVPSTSTQPTYNHPVVIS